LIRAAVGHFAFEKIHPFVDGNGRVGRLISQFIIDNRAENFSGLLPFEEQIENSREVYYSLLANEGRDITEFVEYFLERLNLAADKIIGQLKLSPKEIKPEDTLLPRRKEIVQLLRDHHDMSFDQIHRRFFAIRPNTLRNDLRQLTKQKIIIKLGATRGVVYQYNRNN
jgi:Fic family protein